MHPQSIPSRTTVNKQFIIRGNYESLSEYQQQMAAKKKSAF